MSKNKAKRKGGSPKKDGGASVREAKKLLGKKAILFRINPDDHLPELIKVRVRKLVPSNDFPRFDVEGLDNSGDDYDSPPVYRYVPRHDLHKQGSKTYEAERQLRKWCTHQAAQLLNILDGEQS